MITFLTGRYKTAIRFLWKLTFGSVFIITLLVVAINYNFFWLFGGMPPTAHLENPKSELASELVSADGQVLGKYFLENRTPVTYNEIPQTVVKALLATEDVRFESHSGIDARGLLRSIAGLFTFSTSKGGASTLTQQVAKNLFETRGQKYRGALGYVPGVRTIVAKIKEWITAIKLERSYTKKEIIEMYLNTVSFNNNAFGIKSAAKIYFNRPVGQLQQQEAALLIGMLQNPTKFNPRRNREAALHRRNIVLRQMQKYNFLTQYAADKFVAKPIELNFKPDDHNSGQAPYFRTVVQEDIEKILEDLNKDRNEDDQLDIYRSGLKIHSTIDSRLQTYAVESVNEHMADQQKKFNEHWGRRNPWTDESGKEIKNFIFDAARRTPRYQELQQIYGDDQKAINKVMNTQVPMRVFSWQGERDTMMTPIDSIKYYKRFLNIGFMAMDPSNGHIKAWVGGINYKYFKYDHVRQSRRQPGSTFKPFIYTAAFINNAFSPCDVITDEPVSFGAADGISSTWTPKNSDGVYSYQSMSLRKAMAKSINTAAAFLMKKTGPEKCIDVARQMGITSQLPALPSLCLGSGEVSLYEMVGAYGTFANSGRHTEPMFITRIEDKHGNILYENNPKVKDAISEDMAYQMVYMLKGGLQEAGGTSNSLKSYNFTQGNDVGGKTGTTSNFSDAWYMGITKALVAGVWVGGDERSIHFRSIQFGQGARQAMPAYAKFMEKAFADPEIGLKKGTFTPPANLSVNLDCSKSIPDSTATVVPSSDLPDDNGFVQ
jgi:penicillin-binding protein 1A